MRPTPRGTGAGAQIVELGLPTDRSGFVRRQCRWCQRHFKLRPGGEDALAVQRWASRTVPALLDGEPTALEHLRCPYCAGAGTREDWLTPEHRARIERFGERLRGVLTFTSLAQLTGGLGHSARPTVLPVPPEPLIGGLGREPDDLRTVALVCCEAEVKIHGDWDRGLFCPHCGTLHERPVGRLQVRLTFIPE